MDLKKIENHVLKISPFVKEIEVVLKDDALFANIYPDFQALKDAKVLNIENEIKWYAVELYNLEVKNQDVRIEGFKIFQHPLNESSKEKQEEIEPNDEIYKVLKEYILSISNKKEINIYDHLEFDVGLDSLNHVELLVFIEESFGVKIDEGLYSQMLIFDELYSYIKKHHTKSTSRRLELKDIVDDEIEDKLIYSPYIILLYRIVLLPLFKLYFRLDVKGVENIPDTPCIFAPSHQSMLDGFLLGASMPYKVMKKTFFLAFKQVFGTKLFSIFSKNAQMLLIDANSDLKHSMQLTALTLKEKQNVVIFPEGARTRDRKLMEFRPFFAMLSKYYNVPVVPVTIDGTFEALESGAIFPKPKKTRVAFLEPIHPEDLSVEDITEQTKNLIQKDLDRNSILK